jgi:hypothetical protein
MPHNHILWNVGEHAMYCIDLEGVMHGRRAACGPVKTQRTISWVTRFGLNPNVCTADLSAAESLPVHSVIIIKVKGVQYRDGARQTSERTWGGDPAEQQDDESECDNNINHFSHALCCRNTGWMRRKDVRKRFEPV